MYSPVLVEQFCSYEAVPHNPQPTADTPLASECFGITVVYVSAQTQTHWAWTGV